MVFVFAGDGEIETEPEACRLFEFDDVKDAAVS